MAVDLTDEPICGAPSPSEFRFCTDSETISGTPSTPSAGFLTDSEINPGTLPPPPSPSTPASLPDTEPWDNYPSPPALLDLLDTSDGSVSSGRRSESPPRLREDINSDPDGEHSYRDQPRAEMEPADSSTEVHNHEGAQRTLHCGDEAFVSHAVGDFFKHANVCMELDRVRLEVLRAQCATDLNLRVDLEARVVHWLYYVGSSPYSLPVRSLSFPRTQIPKSKEGSTDIWKRLRNVWATECFLGFHRRLNG